MKTSFYIFPNMVAYAQLLPLLGVMGAYKRGVLFGKGVVISDNLLEAKKLRVLFLFYFPKISHRIRF